MRRLSQKGFTLIELMIVVAIFSVLAAVLSILWYGSDRFLNCLTSSFSPSISCLCLVFSYITRKV